eukprot:15362411-Ditylum_brightwellii.AAC.1
MVATARRQMPENQRMELEAHVIKTFVNMLFQGKLPQAVWWLTGQEEGGLLLPTDRCTKSGKLVLEVLGSKHPEPVEPHVETLRQFQHVLAFMNVNVTATMVEKATRNLLGTAGPDGIDAVMMAD